MCRTRAESTPAEGTGQPGTSAAWRVPHEWAVGAVMGCGGWRRCGAPGLARTSYSSMLHGHLQRPCARPPLPLPRQPGINARPGRRSGARGLSEGPPLHDRLRWFAWMTGEVGRVRRTVGPRRGSWAGPGPRSSVNAASPTLRWLRPKGQGERGPARDGGSPRMDYARGLRLALASMAVRCAACQNLARALRLFAFHGNREN